MDNPTRDEQNPSYENQLKPVMNNTTFNKHLEREISSSSSEENSVHFAYFHQQRLKRKKKSLILLPPSCSSVLTSKHFLLVSLNNKIRFRPSNTS